MKKLVALLLAGVMTLSLAACGNQSSKSEDKKETSKKRRNSRNLILARDEWCK